jgi:hypothetical protein
MAGEPRRMARKLEAIWEVEGEGIAAFREEESPGRNWKTWSSVLQLQQGVSSRGASSLLSISYLAFVRFPFVRCGMVHSCHWGAQRWPTELHHLRHAEEVARHDGRTGSHLSNLSSP